MIKVVVTGAPLALALASSPVIPPDSAAASSTMNGPWTWLPSSTTYHSISHPTPMSTRGKLLCRLGPQLWLQWCSSLHGRTLWSLRREQASIPICALCPDPPCQWQWLCGGHGLVIATPRSTRWYHTLVCGRGTPIHISELDTRQLADCLFTLSFLLLIIIVTIIVIPTPHMRSEKQPPSHAGEWSRCAYPFQRCNRQIHRGIQIHIGSGIENLKKSHPCQAVQSWVLQAKQCTTSSCKLSVLGSHLSVFYWY